MIHGKSKVYIVVFTISLLFFAIIIRSEIVIDRSFLPRFLLISIVLLIAFLTGIRGKKFVMNNLFTTALLLFYLVNLISSLWATAPSEALMQSQMVFLSLAIFLIIYNFTSEYGGFENIFIRTLLFILLFSFGLALYRMISLPLFDPYRIISVSANNNLYSAFLIISLPLVFTGYSLNRGFWRYLSALIGIMSIFFIVIVQSRAGYLSLFTAGVIFILFLVFRYREVFTKRNVLTGIVASLILLSGIFLFYSSLDSARKSYFLSKIPVWQYFRSYENASAERLLKMSKEKAELTQMAPFDFSEEYYENANLRIIFWKKSLCLIKSNPFLGVGAGNWRLSIPSCPKPENPEHTIKNYTYSQPHNEWIGIISELGIIGFILSIFIFLVPVGIVLYRIINTVPKPHISVVFYISFIIGFYIFCMFDFPLKRVEHNVILFSVFAFMLHRVPLKTLNIGDSFFFKNKGNEGDLEGAQGQNNHLQGRIETQNRLIRKVISLLFVVLLMFSVLIAIARIRGEYFTLGIFRNEKQNDDKVIQSCKKAENMFYAITPNTLPVAWFEGVAHYRKGDVDSALTCFTRALRSTPYEVRVLNDYATVLYSLDKSGEAKSVLLYILSLDPHFDDARFNLGAIYYFSGQRDSALYHITRCRDSQKKDEFMDEMGQ